MRKLRPGGRGESLKTPVRKCGRTEPRTWFLALNWWCLSHEPPVRPDPRSRCKATGAPTVALATTKQDLRTGSPPSTQAGGPRLPGAQHLPGFRGGRAEGAEGARVKARTGQVIEEGAGLASAPGYRTR